MTRFLASACLALALFVGLAMCYPETARAQYYVSPICPAPAPVVSYYVPAPVVTSYYAPPAYTYSYYAPTYAAPVYAYSAPVTSYYAAPAAVSTSYYYRPGILRPRVYASSSYYYPTYSSSYYYPAYYYSPMYYRY
jgi:hypothetical protein